MQGSKNQLTVIKGEASIAFDIIIKIYQGKLFYVNMQRTGEIGAVAIEMSKDKAYRVLGHAGPDAMVATEKALGWKLTGVQHVCVSCQMVKAKQKSVLKELNYIKAQHPGE